MQARQKSFTLEILLSHGKITRLGSPRKQPTFYIISLDILSFHTCPSVPERPEVEILEVSRGRVSQRGGYACSLIPASWRLILPIAMFCITSGVCFLRLRLDGYFIHASSVQRLHFLVVWFLVPILFIRCIFAHVSLSCFIPASSVQNS